MTPRLRKEDIKRRAATPDLENRYCKVLGCPNPSRAGTSDGVGRRYCRQHYDHYQRHGSAFQKSYSAKQLEPHKRAAKKFIRENKEDRWVQHAIGKVKQLYRRAGQAIPASSLRGLPPRDRAWVAWARLRKANVPAEQIVVAWLTIELTIQGDPQADRKAEFKRVQGAKLIHRLASGTHKQWTHQYRDGSGEWTEEMHVYPHSRGRVLRHLGEDLEKACELLVDKHINEIGSYNHR